MLQMTSCEKLNEQWWQVAFRISHNGGFIAHTLRGSNVLKGMEPLTIDRDVNMTDLVLRLQSRDSTTALGQAAVALWDTFEAEDIQSPIVLNVVLTDGGSIAATCTTQYQALERLSQVFSHATPDILM